MERNIRNDILIRIKEILIIDEELFPEMSLSNDLGIDSLGFIELLVVLENTYDIEFDDSFILDASNDIIGNLVEEIIKMELLKNETNRNS